MASTDINYFKLIILFNAKGFSQAAWPSDREAITTFL